jgi:uncharacterized protein
VIDAFAASLVRHRGRWTAGALLLLTLALLLASRLTFRHEASDFLPRATRPDTTLAGLGGVDRIAVIIEADAPMTAADVGGAIDSLAARLTSLVGVRRVEYRVAPALRRYVEQESVRHLLLYFTPAELDSLGQHLTRDYMERALLHVGEPIPRSRVGLALGIEHTDPLGVVGPALSKLRAMAPGRIRLVDGYFAVPDQGAFFLTIEPARRLAGLDSARALLRAIDSVLIRSAPLFPGRRLSAIGRPVAVVQGFDIAFGDVQRVGIASMLVVLALLIGFLRRPLAPALIIGTVLYGIALTAGTAFLVFKSISLLGWVFIASLVGFGDEFALYVLAHYWISTPPGTSRAAALASAIRRPGPGILLGGLTSAAAFFSLVVLSYPVMVELAWLSTIGLLLIVACSFTVLPLALAYTSPGSDAESHWYRWSGTVHRQGQRGRGIWLAGWAVLVAAGLWAGRSLRYELHPWKLAVRGIPVTAELERMAERLGASFTPFLMVSRGASAEQALDADRAAVAELEAIRDRAGIGAIISPSSWIPSGRQQTASLAYLHSHADLFSASRFRRDFVSVAARMPRSDTMLTSRYLPAIERYLGPAQPVSLDTLRRVGMEELVGQHLVRRGEAWLAISEIYLTQVPWAAGAVDQFTGVIDASGGPALRQVHWVGDALRSATRAPVLRRNMIAATALALSLTLLVLVLRFRRVDLVLLCMLPLVCGVAAALGAMALFGIELNILTLATTPLIVGLGSDDGIHIVDRLERGEPLAHVLAETGPPMVITTVTTIAGFACFAFARFPGVREMGLVAAWGLVVCLAASMQLVPMVYGMLRRGR